MTHKDAMIALAEAMSTPRADAIKKELAEKYPDPIPADRKLAYYMEAAECFGQLAREMELEAKGAIDAPRPSTEQPCSCPETTGGPFGSPGPMCVRPSSPPSGCRAQAERMARMRPPTRSNGVKPSRTPSLLLTTLRCKDTPTIVAAAHDAALRIEELERELADAYKVVDENWVTHQQVIAARSSTASNVPHYELIGAWNALTLALEQELGPQNRVWGFTRKVAELIASAPSAIPASIDRELKDTVLRMIGTPFHTWTRGEMESVLSFAMEIVSAAEMAVKDGGKQPAAIGGGKQ
jgi:hypothetical protein